MPNRRPFATSVAISALALIAVPSLASAGGGGLDVKIADDDLGKVWDAGKVQVKVDPPSSGKAEVTVKVTGAGKAKTIAKGKDKVDKSGGKIDAKLTKKGRDALLDCDDDGLQAKVTFFETGDKPTQSDHVKAKQTIATCSTGSEDPDQHAYHGPKIDTKHAGRCDFLDPSLCMYPFPNDYFTVNDGSSATGKRINFNIDSMPVSANTNLPIDVTDYNRADGFSPGSPIIVHIPGMDNQQAFDQSGLVPVNDLAAYDDTDQPAVVINADTGKRQPIWSELDANATDDSDRVLYIRPAVNFDEGGHYIVALRNLKDANGDPIGPDLAFRSYRDRLKTKDSAIEDRRAHMEDLFTTLQGAGIQRANLDLAWDFTVSSEGNIADRVLAMRDDAFHQLGDDNLSNLTVEGDSPDFTIDEVTNYLPCSAGVDSSCEAGEDDQKLRQVKGTLDVPCYLNTDGCPPTSRFAYDGPSDLTPNFNPTFRMSVPFTCIIPRSVVNGGVVVPARPSMYGHGLLGSHDEVESGTGGNIKAMANEHNFDFCAVDWAGFAEEDAFGGVIDSLKDMGNFPEVADRVQQGFINFLYLGRAMIHPDGFTDNAAFQVDPDGAGGEDASSVIDTSHLYYDGNSQGGILGGALTALAPDFTRASLGVPAMNYSTLLQRSTDFADYAPILYGSYPSQLEQPLVFGIVQMLWDRAEPDGYAEHMTTDPYEDTPQHQVLMQLAFGDFQVSNYAAETEARTIGAQAYQPALDAGRHWDPNPLFGIPAIADPNTYGDSAIVYWDGGPKGFAGTINPGTSPPPLVNIAASDPADGHDPHSYVRRDVQARSQKSQFLQPGGTLMPCAGDGPCYSNGFTGAP